MKQFFPVSSCGSLLALLLVTPAAGQDRPSPKRLFQSLPLNQQLILDVGNSPEATSLFRESALQGLLIPAGTFPPAGGAQPHTLTFPHTANGSQEGLEIISNVFGFNNSGLTAHGTVRFTRSDGTPFVVTTNLGTGSEFPFSLGRGQILKLTTDGKGPVGTGWVEISSDIPLSGAGTFEILDGSGDTLSEVGVGNSPRSTKFMLFVDTRNGRSTAWAVANPNAAGAANLTLELRRLDGSLVASRQLPLEAGRQINEFVSQTFAAQDLSGFRGFLLICSDGPEVSVTTLRTRGVRFTSFPAAPLVTDTSDEGILILPRIGDGVFGEVGLATTVVLLNNSEEDAIVDLQVFGVTGNPLEITFNETRDSTFQVHVPAGTAAELTSDASTTPGVVGWIAGESDIPIFGGAAFTLSRTTNGAFLSEVGVPASAASDLTSVYTAVTGEVDTGVSITNISPTTVTARIRLISAPPQQAGAATSAPAALSFSPSILGETSLDLPPLGHAGLFATQLFAEIPAIQARNFEGRMEILSFAGDELGAAELVSNLTLRSRGTLLTSMPVAGRVTNFAPDLTFYTATAQAGATPEAGFDLFQLIGDRGVANTVITLDKGSVRFEQIEEAQPIGYVLVDQVNYVFGKLFAVNVTPDSADFFATTVASDSMIQITRGRVENRTEGGVRVEVYANSELFSGGAEVAWNTRTRLRFLPGLFQLPASAAQPILVEAVCTAFPKEGEEEIQISAAKILELADHAPGPLIQQVDSFRFAGGQEIDIRGTGFSGSNGGNRVFLQDTTEEVELVVLEDSAGLIRARLPDQASPGALHVESGGEDSNPYQVEVVFAPVLEMSTAPLASPGGRLSTAATGLEVETHQQPGQTFMAAFAIGGAGVNLMTTGFAPGAKVGEYHLSYLDYGNLGPVSESIFDLLVESSNSQELTLNAVDPEDEDQESQAVVTLTPDGFVRFRALETGGANVRLPFLTRTRILMTEGVLDGPLPAQVTAAALSQFDLDNIRSVQWNVTTQP